MEELKDLELRIMAAHRELEAIIQTNVTAKRPEEIIRLRGKQEGLRLVLDYLNFYR